MDGDAVELSLYARLWLSKLMNKKVILITVSGLDKRGLVSALSKVVAEHSGNWLEGRMANLAGNFIGILRVEIGEDHQKDLLASLETLNDAGLTVSWQPAIGDNENALPEGRDVVLDIMGQDHVGIVRDITQVLTQNGISVQSLDTTLEEASMAGGMVFHAKVHLRLPNHLSRDDLHEKLESISDSLHVEVELADA